MSDRGAHRGEQQSREILQDRIHAWWTAVLAGQPDQPHPVHGSNVTARIEDGVLILRGKVASPADVAEFDREIEHLRGDGLPEIRNEVEVAAEIEEAKGLLTQTLMAVFETDEQSGFARGYLEGHANVDPRAITVVSSGEKGDVIRDGLSEAYAEDARRALDAGRSLLIVTVDETEAFRVRELLDEETQSLETVVLPPRSVEDEQALSRGH